MAKVEIERQGARSCIKLGPKLTVTEVPSLQTSLKQEMGDGVNEMVFDFAGTSVLDSSGIGLLIATNNSLGKIKGSLSLINVSDDILRLLQSMRLVDRLNATGAGGKAVARG